MGLGGDGRQALQLQDQTRGQARSGAGNRALRWSRAYNERRVDLFTERQDSDDDEADWENMEEAQGYLNLKDRQPPGRTPAQCMAEDNARSASIFWEEI